MFDCIIIGAGVVGCAIADRLTLSGYKILLLEKEDDVATGASRANSGLVHAGYDCKPNTLKAKFNAEGCKIFKTLAAELDVPYINTGSLVVAKKDGLEGVKELEQKGIKNGIRVEVIGRDKILSIEPNIADDIEYALYAPDASVISPYKLTIAFADRAVLNGAKVLLECKVNSISKDGGVFNVKTDKGDYQAKIVINSAGSGCGGINELAGAEKLELNFARGEYFVLDQTERNNINIIVFPLPDENGKGILVAPTADGNVIYGPTSIPTSGVDAIVTAEGLDRVRIGISKIYKCPNYRKVIRLYSGVRTAIGSDFVIRYSDIVKNFLYLGGICSPGLSSAPAIANYVGDMVAGVLPKAKPLANPVIELRHKRLNRLSANELNSLVKQDNRWGRIICRCEKVTEAEIVNAIHSPVPATTVDAVKRRVRAGMGRCQGGFCAPRVMEILSRELKIPMTQIKKGGENSEIAICEVKDIDNTDENKLNNGGRNDVL